MIFYSWAAPLIEMNASAEDRPEGEPLKLIVAVIANSSTSPEQPERAETDCHGIDGYLVRPRCSWGQVGDPGHGRTNGSRSTAIVR